MTASEPARPTILLIEDDRDICGLPNLDELLALAGRFASDVAATA